MYYVLDDRDIVLSNWIHIQYIYIYIYTRFCMFISKLYFSVLRSTIRWNFRLSCSISNVLSTLTPSWRCLLYSSLFTGPAQYQATALFVGVCSCCILAKTGLSSSSSSSSSLSILAVEELIFFFSRSNESESDFCSGWSWQERACLPTSRPYLPAQ